MNENEWDRRSVFDRTHDGYLPAEGAIVEVGGFEGRWLGLMHAAHGARRYVAFEPQTWAHERMRERWVRARADAMPCLRDECSLEILPYGLGIEAGTFTMGGWGTDANSFLLDDAFYEAHPEEGRNERGQGELRLVEEVFDELALAKVAALMVNIEGYEYKLLPHMYGAGLLARCEIIGVQFHRVHDDEHFTREGMIRGLIEETHRLLWDYPALTAWKRIPA